MDNGTSASDEQRITAVEVAGFKSAASPVRVNLRDITILSGANSTGKSTIMQPLLLIKQTMEKSFDPGGLAIDGPLVRFTSGDQFFSHVKSKSSIPRFDLTLMQSNRRTRLSYGRSASSGIGVVEMSFSRSGKEFTWVDGQYLDVDDESLGESRAEEWPTKWSSRKQKESALKLRVTRNRVMLIAEPVSSDLIPLLHLFPVVPPANMVINEVQNMIYLPGLRGNPERHYVISAAGPQYSGSFNDYVASIIHHWGTTKDSRLKLLEYDLKSLGLTWRLTTRAIDDTRVEVRVGRLPKTAQGGAHDTVNIADVGLGVSQTLPVLVALLAATKGQIVFVEQPELHLHPRAQVALADIILQAADRGARVVIETHSSLLILALQMAVAEGRLAPSRLSLNWFTRDRAGQTHIAEADVAKDGSYGDWPVDFDDVEFDLQNRYLNLTDRLRAEG